MPIEGLLTTTPATPKVTSLKSASGGFSISFSRGSRRKSASFHDLSSTGSTTLGRLPFNRLNEFTEEEYVQGTLLLRDCANGNIDNVRKMLTAHPNLCHFKDYDHRTPLHVSASEGNEPIVSMLLEMGADPNQSDRWGSSPLDDAQRSQFSKVVALLQKFGGQGGVMDYGVELSLACSRGNVERARQIIEDGANVNSQDFDKRTPLHLAALGGHVNVCNFLLEVGANVNCEDRWGRTPLDYAHRKRNALCVEALSKAGGKASVGAAPEKNAEAPQSTASKGLDYSASSMEVDWADVTVIEKIGMGGFGEIFKCRWRGSMVAAKRMRGNSAKPNSDAIEDFKAEIELLMHLRHPNICLLLGYSLTESHEVMISELMKCSLHDVMKATGGTPLALERTLRYSIQFAQGMAYLHTSKPPILHRDLKPANLLLDFTDTLKVADFGLARLRNPRSDSSAPTTYVPYVMTGETGSYRYMAPEVFRHEKYGRPVDVYSFSLILYLMLVGDEPWAGTDGALAVKQAATNMDRPKIPRHVSSQLRNLLRVAWDDNPVNRPSFPAVLEQLENVHLSQFNMTYDEKLQLGQRPASCECTIS
ncbi:hypothetical protein AB1Y20_010049 [Prymnesium parvum]|uniref:Protein kinase domain-containing protein n=1 Tax=Prymnesium parvum TaxID=97485 RepID=A0AB34K6U1_PRYPA